MISDDQGVEKWGKLMVEKAGTRNKGLEESLDGLRKLVDKMKVEGTSKQVEFGNAIERLRKMVGGINEKSNKMEKVAVLPKPSSLYYFLMTRELKGPLKNWANR